MGGTEHRDTSRVPGNQRQLRQHGGVGHGHGGPAGVARAVGDDHERGIGEHTGVICAAEIRRAAVDWRALAQVECLALGHSAPGVDDDHGHAQMQGAQLLGDGAADIARAQNDDEHGRIVAA